MHTKPILHFAMMCNQSNGGFDSALTLIDGLREEFEVVPWSLLGQPYKGHQQLFKERGLSLNFARPVAKIRPGDAVMFYMNDYPMHFRNYSREWELCLSKASSVQIAFNRTLGALPLEHWLADKLQRVYFQDKKMRNAWADLVRASPLANVPSAVLPPPVVLDEFLAINKESKLPCVVGRLAGDANLPASSVALYQNLHAQYPATEFWFMPSPPELQEAFGKNSNFRFYQPNEISVVEFFSQCDIFLLNYANGIPVPGPRSLVEAMAAECAPVVVNREGPKARVEHGVSGFCADNDDDFFRYVSDLLDKPHLRQIISEQARQRARSFKVQEWITQINETALSELQP